MTKLENIDFDSLNTLNSNQLLSWIRPFIGTMDFQDLYEAYWKLLLDKQILGDVLISCMKQGVMEEYYLNQTVATQLFQTMLTEDFYLSLLKEKYGFNYIIKYASLIVLKLSHFQSDWFWRVMLANHLEHLPYFYEVISASNNYSAMDQAIFCAFETFWQNVSADLVLGLIRKLNEAQYQSKWRVISLIKTQKDPTFLKFVKEHFMDFYYYSPEVLSLCSYCNVRVVNGMDLTPFLRLYRCAKPYMKSGFEKSLSRFIKNGQIKEALEALKTELEKTQTVRSLTPGTSSYPFVVCDSVIKFKQIRGTARIDNGFYRCIPSCEVFLHDEKQRLYIEWQLLGINQRFVTKEDIYWTLKEMHDAGIYVYDIYCLSFAKSNFAFLKDYHMANIEGFLSAEELPERFKSRPVVLVDVDWMFTDEDLENHPTKYLKPYRSLVLALHHMETKKKLELTKEKY